MKEYKIVQPKFSFTKRFENTENLLNLNAREGWVVKHIEQGMVRIVFERDKNR